MKDLCLDSHFFTEYKTGLRAKKHAQNVIENMEEGSHFVCADWELDIMLLNKYLPKVTPPYD